MTDLAPGARVEVRFPALVGSLWVKEGPSGPPGADGVDGAPGADGAPGGVTSVNTKTGIVVLAASDVDAASRKKGGAESVAAGSATTGTVTLDCATASIFTIAPTGNITLSPSNVPASGTGCTITVIINQGATVRTLTMPGGSVWLGSAPTQAASKKCVVTMLTTDGGTTWLSSGVVQA